MSDGSNGTPTPTPYDDSAGFRETYLREIPADKRSILRQLAEWIIDTSREAGMVEVPDELNRAEMTAVAADLRQCVGSLYQVAWHGKEASVEPSSLRLVLLAGELAPRLEQIAGAIETAIAASTPVDPE